MRVLSCGGSGTGTGVSGPREREKARVRRELIDAALRLFERHGFEQTTVQQIADAVRVSR
ncbi:helix-turn-helix domain-containing protein, partial [Nocardia asiatica]|uniref:helix-turn-helix domain-containing protein n=1 Tax=Nocardia asiatica TaxID=209252 RepID=UPI002454CCE1